VSFHKNYLEGLLFIYPRRLSKYALWIGWPSAFQLLAFKFLQKRKKLPVQVRGKNLQIRTCGSDVLVAAENLYYQEYAKIESEQPQVIIDAGANIGASAIHFATTYPDARIYALEPDEENFLLMQENTRAYPNITVIRAALWSSEGKGDPDWPWGYTVSPTAGTGAGIQFFSLDSLMKTYGIDFIDILKVDIEGAENEVFEASDEWIGKVGIISVELHDGMKMGASRAFYLATQKFQRFEKHGEMIVAYAK